MLHNPQVKTYFKHLQEGQLLPISIPYYPTQGTPATSLSGQSGSQPAVRLLGAAEIRLMLLKLFQCHYTQKKPNVYPQKDHKGIVKHWFFSAAEILSTHCGRIIS